MAARITFSVVNTPAAEIQRTLRSFAAKVDIDSLKPGADITLGNVRVQVSTPQLSDKRAWGIENGFAVGARGRYSAELTEAYNAAVKADKAAKAAERKAAREAKLVNA